MFGRTIYVSNHAASFMDPLVVASFRPPIVFFLTRSDVFTKLTKPFLWAAHMLPIYRQQDGVDTKDENIRTFDECTKILKYGRNLLIFGEGFTDDVFIRRLKPVKKGAVRIGFYSLEKLNWKKKIYIAAVGCNYSDPNEMRSDLLISTSKRICLNDYRQEYEVNPIKVINELTREIELLMREQITHVEDIDNLNFHENIMKLTRKGMNAKHSNTSIPLVKRWHYSQKLANWLNDRAENQLTELRSLKEELHDYFNLLGKLNVNENYLHELSLNHRINRIKELILLIVLSPTALLGLFHCGLPYLFVKRYVERSFKRKVFWGSVKLLLGMISMGILNIPFIFVIRYFIYPNYWVAFGYYALIGLFGLSAYMWWRNFIRYREKGIIRHTDLSKIIDKRGELIEKIYQQIPVA
ncbi:MAG: 1-acyl-sn-glycerol-3-phosphate acyltransferase [Flavobacteriales bacterium]